MKQARTRRFHLGLLALVAASAPALAELLPPRAAVAVTREKAVMDALAAALAANRGTRGSAGMVALDRALAQLPAPTRERGIVQMMRADALAAADADGGSSDAPARAAIDEAVRLLPGQAPPLLLASNIYAYADLPGEAADFFIRGSRIDPAAAARIPQYEVDNLFARLAFRDDDARTGALSERLLAIGWRAAGLSARSALARRAIAARIEAGDVAGARALVPRLAHPADARDLLAQNRYRPLWPAIDAAAGPRLESLWRAYLPDARRAWERTGDPEAARPFVSALDAANYDQTIVREMLPLFERPLDARRDVDLIFVVTPVAGALARGGRWDEVDALFARAGKVWPLGETANALNVAANRAMFLLYRDRPAEGLAAMDAAIADAARWGGQVNASALLAMHAGRACMLHALGRDASGAAERARASRPPSLADVSLHLCLGRPEAAREVVMARLATEAGRDEAVLWAQPVIQRPMDSAYGRTIHARTQALRSDPRLLAAIAEHGRVLPYALADGAPGEAER